MGIAKLRTVTLVKDKDHASLFQAIHLLAVFWFFYRRVEFLNGGDNERVLPRHLFHQRRGGVLGIFPRKRT